jgi:hypothetical protein
VALIFYHGNVATTILSQLIAISVTSLCRGGITMLIFHDDAAKSSTVPHIMLNNLRKRKEKLNQL